MTLDAQPMLLVVEDHDDTREMLAEYLRAVGWRVETAQDGVEALERTHEETPAVVLLDFAMPRMDGLTFLELFRKDEATQSVPVIGLTGQGPAAQRAMLNAGATQVLTKPYDFDLLRASIARQLAPDST